MRSRFRRSWLVGALATLTVLVAAGVAAAVTAGSWEAYPGQSTSYATTVQQPINQDGSSNFKANGKAVIPIKFALAKGTGSFVFESIFGDTSTDNDFSFLSFTPSGTLTLGEVSELVANYAFTLGNCHGGALRWSVRTSVSPPRSLFIYYGDYPSFTDCTTTSQSGTNMIGLGDLRYDTSQYPGGTFYDTYANALAVIGPSTPIVRASLVLDAGWAGNQRLTLTSATVNGNTFTPATPSPLAPTCDLPADATIKVTKTDGVPLGDVNEPVSVVPANSDGVFRVVDCKLMYNLATSSLSGPGTYTVYAVINGVQASNPAVFDLK